MNMQETLIEQLIADSEERTWPDATERDVSLPSMAQKANAVIGMRRVGKTWLLQDRLREIVDAGAPRNSVLYINFEDERLWPLRAEHLQLIVEAFYRRNPALRERHCTWVLDEIQLVAGWEQFVRRILDTEQVHLCVSGSSAKMLSREIATSLRGRSVTTELFPFSFPEALRHQHVDGIDATPVKRPGKSQRSQMEHAFGRYLVDGGFPEVQGIKDDVRRGVLQSYVDAVILRDVIERHNVGNTSALRRLTRQLLAAPAQLFSVNRTYNDLRSQGLRVSKNSLHAYLDHLQDAFFVFAVHIYSASERVRQTNPRKIYPIDPGIVTACAPTTGWGVGQLLETTAFLHLRRQGDPISYYRHEDGTEVDFVKSGLNEAFSFRNPNVSGECGCGESFNV